MATNAARNSAPGGQPGPSVIVPPDPAHPRKLSEEFAMILREFVVETVTLREVIGLLQGRGYVLLVMLLVMLLVLLMLLLLLLMLLLLLLLVLLVLPLLLLMYLILVT